MTEYKARIKQVHLSIFVPWPDELREDIRLENEAAKSALAGFPDFVVTLRRIEETKAASAFVEKQDYVAIRAEFRRKAKKLDIALGDGLFPVSIDSDSVGVSFTICWRA